MRFLEGHVKQIYVDMSRSSSTLLIVLLMIFTFPLWIGILGGLFGLVAGLFGAIVGLIAGLFGATFGLFSCWPHFPFSGATVIVLIFLIVLLSRSKAKK